MWSRFRGRSLRNGRRDGELSFGWLLLKLGEIEKAVSIVSRFPSRIEGGDGVEGKGRKVMGILGSGAFSNLGCTSSNRLLYCNHASRISHSSR